MKREGSKFRIRILPKGAIGAIGLPPAKADEDERMLKTVIPRNARKSMITLRVSKIRQHSFGYLGASLSLVKEVRPKHRL